MNLKNRSLAAGTCLISALAQDLLRSQELIRQTHVILPTQRLKLYLTRELLQRTDRAGLILPRISTWDQFVDSFVNSYGPSNAVMVSSQAELLMEQAIAAASAKTSVQRRLHANPAHAHELLQFYSDLIRSDAYQQGKAKILERLQNQWHRSPEALLMLSERVEDVFTVLSEFESLLESRAWTTKPKERSQALGIFLDPTSQDASFDLRHHLFGSRTIVAGLTSLPKTEQKLLERLNACREVEVWLDEPPPRLKNAPLIALRQSVGLPAVNAQSDSWAKNVKSITAAPDVTHEALHAMSVAEHLMTSGVAAHDIAIIVPDEKNFGPAFTAVKTFFESNLETSLQTPVTVNLPLATAWDTSLIGSWLALTKDAALGGNLASLGHFLLHPVTQQKFNPKESQFPRLQEKLKDFPDPFDIRSPATRNFLFANFSKVFADYIIEASLWCYGLEANPCKTADAMAEKLSAIVDLARSNGSTSARGHEAWSIFSESILQAQELDPILKYSQSDWPKFLSHVYRLCSSQSLRYTGEPMSGLQILGLTEARYVPITHAILVGCVEGSFPHSLPVDSLIDNSLRQSAGLPGWSELEALEDTTFHLLTCRIPNIYLSYSLFDGDTPQIRSRWIEQIGLKMNPILSDNRKAQRWLGCSLNQSEVEPLAESSPGEGKIDQPAALLSTASASRLKSLLHCPYRYLMESKGVISIELPEDRKQLKIGQWLHKILELFFAQNESANIDPELRLTECPTHAEEFVGWAVARLESLVIQHVPKDIRLSEDFQQMLGKGWEDLANFWARLISAGFSLKNVKTELPIGKTKVTAINVDGRSVSIRGSIDALHSSDPFAIIVDYKTSSIPSRKQISSGLEPQLPLYSMVITQGQVDLAGGAPINPENVAAVYFNLRDGKPSFASVGREIKPLLQSVGLLSKAAKPDDMNDVIQMVESRWTSRLRSISVAQRFEADPSSCEYCPFDGICRKDDPRYKKAISSQLKADKEL